MVVFDNSYAGIVESPRVRSVVKDVGDFVPDDELDDDFFQVDDKQNGGNNEDSSDSDEEYNHNPQVAIDEDLSSVEEEPIVEELTKEVKTIEPKQPKSISTGAYKSAHKVVLTETESESEEEHVKLEQPLVPNIESKQPLIPTPLPSASLKPARDINLTESEDEDPAIVEQQHTKEKVIEQKQKTKKSSKPKNDGLLLAFNTPPSKPIIPNESSTKSSSRKRSEKNSDLLLDITESPPTRSKKDKHEGKSHRKKSKQKEEAKPEEIPTQNKADDPWGFNSSLDAWLADEVMFLKNFMLHVGPSLFLL